MTRCRKGIFLSLFLVFLSVAMWPWKAGADEESETSWMRVIGVQAEVLTTLDNKSFKAGYMIPTSIVPAPDGNFLVTGYIEPYAGHDADVFLLSLRPDGGIEWFREYAVGRPSPMSQSPVPRDPCRCVAFAQVVSPSDGGAALFFNNVFLRLDSLFEPQLAYQYESQEAGGSASLFITSALTLEDETFVVAGNYYPPSQEDSSSASVFLVRLGPSGDVLWAKLYHGLTPCQKPQVALSPKGFLILGADPQALVGVDPADGRIIWASQLYHLPFERGPKDRPDRGELQHYCSLGVTDEGDIIFGGIYELAYTPAYRKPDAFVCRLSPYADSVKWAKYIADTCHGGFGSVNAIATNKDSVYLVGTTSATFDPGDLMNANLLAVKMKRDGEVAWLCSLGKKKKSEAQSEYRTEIGNDVVVTDGSVMVVGATDAFALPDPGFHRVHQWAKQRFDMLLARITSHGEIQNLPEGRHPRLLSQPDVSDPKKVDIVDVPVAVREFSVYAIDFACSAQPISCSALAGELQVQFSTVNTTGGMEMAGAGNRPPVARFTLLEPSFEGELRVRFDGTVSTDPDGDEIAWYRWDFGDGETASSPKPIHMYSRNVRTPNGTILFTQFYDVTLTVWDSRYNEASVTKRIATGYDVRGKGIPAAFCTDRFADYSITIETGDVKNAGTDAMVYFSFYGLRDSHGAWMGTGEGVVGAGEYGSLFERGNKDTLQTQLKDLSDVEMMILRHDNTGNKPGWFVKSVTLKNLGNNKEWHFVINQWLADDEPPNRTWGRFFVTPKIPCALCFKGESYSYGMDEAGGGIFILPSNVDTFYFTCLDRSGYIEVWHEPMLLGKWSGEGLGVNEPPYINTDDWGVKCDTSWVTKPTLFKVKLGKEGYVEKETWVWVFPSSWRGYEKEARKVALLYPLKDYKEGLVYPEKAKTYLQGLATPQDMTAAWQRILNYGAASLGIFIDNPDPRLEFYFSNNTENYSQYKMLKAIAQGLGRGVEEMRPVLSEFFNMMDTLYKAYAWASRLPQIIDLSAAEVYERDLLQEIANNDSTFLQILALFEALRTRLDQLVKAVDNNSPSECRRILQEMRTLAVGNNPKSETLSDHRINYQSLGVASWLSSAEQYPLAIEIGLMLNKIKDWRARWHHYLDGYILEPGLDKTYVTNQCMDVLEPVIKDLAQIASIFIDTALVVDDKDPDWFTP